MEEASHKDYTRRYFSGGERTSFPWNFSADRRCPQWQFPWNSGAFGTLRSTVAGACHKSSTITNGAITYVSSFTCIVMSAIWLKILVAIDQQNQIIQAREATVDAKVSNLKSMLNDLKDLNLKWPSIFSVSKLVADAMQIHSEFSSKRKRKRRAFFDQVPDRPDDASSSEQLDKDGNEEEKVFKRDVFFVIIDSVLAGLTNRYEAANKIDELFSFLRRYLQLSEEGISQACQDFAQKYSGDVSQDQLKEEVIHLKSIHEANFGKKPLSPHELLNKISAVNLSAIFENVCVAMRMFCTLPLCEAR